MTDLFIKRFAGVLLTVLLAACATSAVRPVGESVAEDDESAPIAQVDLDWRAPLQGDVGSRVWHGRNFPGKKPTLYTTVKMDGRDAVESSAVSSASMLRQVIRVEPGDLGQVRFSWKVPALIEVADMTVREHDDSPVRVVLAFDGDRSRFSAKNAMLSELAMALTGEPLPYATLMYVWDNKAPTESVIVNTRTDRVRKLVLESGPAQLNRWKDYERNIRADFVKVYGEPPGALVGIGIMTDADNTQQKATAWYGPVSLIKLPPNAASRSRP